MERMTTMGGLTPGDGHGIDVAPENRPGVPLEAEPHRAEGAHWTSPPRQPVLQTQLKRKGLRDITPVFGTAQPPHGLSGVVRRLAYRAPEHRARHWAALLLADRLDVYESAFGRRLGKPIRDAGWERTGRFIEKDAALLIVAAAAGGYAAGKLIGRLRG